MRDDYAIAADLCEEHGLVAPAGVLRQIADGSGEVFMVRPVEFDVEDQIITGPLVESAIRTRRLFSTREAAEAYAARLHIAFLRDYPWHPREDPYYFTVGAAEFARRVGAILGIDYQLPEGRTTPSIIPDWVSDEQMQAIAPLYSEKHAEVICVPLNPATEA